jgi:hypothetical protein
VLNATTGETPNLIVYGVNKEKEIRSQANDEVSHSELMRNIHKQIELDISWNQQKAKTYYDKKRQDAPDLKIGSYVYLRRRTTGRSEYNIKTKRASDKLDCIHLGPFRIIEKMTNNNYRLSLPNRMRVHPEFHVSLLEPSNATAPQGTEGSSEEFEVEAIKGKRINQKGKTEYLVKWIGYSDKENSWEESTNLFCPDRIREYEGTEDPRKRKRKKSYTVREKSAI